MPYNPDLHHRRSIRLKGYDYSKSGLYFITITTKNNICYFGQVINNKMELNPAGLMLNHQWLALQSRYPHIAFHEYIIMPNHFHAILEILPVLWATLVVAQSAAFPQSAASTPTLGQIIGAYKSITTNKYIKGIKELGWQPFIERLWHRNYYENIIRSEEAINNISNYIRNNPAKWAQDKFRK